MFAFSASYMLSSYKFCLQIHMRKHDGSVVKLKIESLILAPLMMLQNEGTYYTYFILIFITCWYQWCHCYLVFVWNILIFCVICITEVVLPARHCESSDSDEGIKRFVFCFLGILQCRTSFEITLNSLPLKNKLAGIYIILF